jgi:hypothetical protein
MVFAVSKNSEGRHGPIPFGSVISSVRGLRHALRFPRTIERGIEALHGAEVVGRARAARSSTVFAAGVQRQLGELEIPARSDQAILKMLIHDDSP